MTAGSGVDLHHYAYAAPALAEPGQLRFLTLTRLLVDKGVPEFAAAAARLKPTYPQATFSIVGSPETGPGGIADATVARWKREGHVIFGSAVTDVRDELRRAHVYVLASAYREGVPRSVLEAMSVGRAIITTDTPGCRDTVTNGTNGYLVPPRNPAALADAMARLLDEPTTVLRMGEASRALAEARFNVDHVNRAIIRFMRI